MASGLLSLKWNNHRTTFFHVLSTVRSKEAYCDVTLACDGKFYPVHKLVLSTCSDYFERMFERTNCKHPIIVLKDIRHDELEALLNYMYVGEVNVLQNELAGLIKAAECLMIKGLAVPDEAPVKDSKRSSFNREDSPHAKRRRRDDDGRSSSHNQHLQRESSSQRQSSSASLPNPSSRLAPPPSPSPSVGSASDTLSEDISQSQSENNNAQEPAKRPGKEKTSSQLEEVPEVYIDEAGVKEEPTEIEDDDEITETKEMLDPEFSFEPLPEGDSRSDPGGGSGGYDSQVLSSQPQSMEDLVAQAIPGSSGLQGNSLWEGDGSLQGFPIEGYSGDGSRPPQMVMLSLQSYLAIKKGGSTTADKEGSFLPVETIMDESVSSENTENTDQTEKGELRVEESWKTVFKPMTIPQVISPSGKRRAQCSYCLKIFPDKWKLNRHIRTHTGEKPFPCEKCSYRANQKYVLREHMLTHAKSFDCTKCKFKARSYSGLKSHKCHRAATDKDSGQKQ